MLGAAPLARIREVNGIGWLCLAIAVGSVALPQEPKKATYSANIRPILVEKCTPCHHTEGLGPFALQTYEQTKRRGDLVRLVALTGQMPPTDARSEFSSLTPHAPLNSKELRDIQEWFRLGMPEGAKTPKIPGPTQKTVGETKQVLSVAVGKGQIIPAEGRSSVIIYPLNSLTNRVNYLHQFSFQPDAPKAVKQAVLAIQRQGEPEPFSSTGLRPGTSYAAWAEGFNKFTSAGCIAVMEGDRLWLRLTAVPTGKQEPASGLITIARESRQDKILTKTVGNMDFVIQPEDKIILSSGWTLESDIELISVLPEARLVTEQVSLIARDGTNAKTVFMVHTWDSIWPGAYNFPKPVRLKKGTILSYEASIMNSKHGHAAEDEQVSTVRFGPKPTDELFWCHINYIPR